MSSRLGRHGQCPYWHIVHIPVPVAFTTFPAVETVERRRGQMRSIQPSAACSSAYHGDSVCSRVSRSTLLVRAGCFDTHPVTHMQTILTRGQSVRGPP